MTRSVAPEAANPRCRLEAGIAQGGVPSADHRPHETGLPLALIVEDNDLNLKLLRDILEIRFRVVAARRADEALKLVAQRRPHLILTDIQLPGMDGVAFTRRLKADAETRDIPVVAISAHALKHNIDEAQAAGCILYVTKPLVEDPLLFVDRLAELARS